MILVVKIRLHRKVTSWKHSQLMFNYVLIYHVSLEIARNSNQGLPLCRSVIQHMCCKLFREAISKYSYIDMAFFIYTIFIFKYLEILNNRAPF